MITPSSAAGKRHPSAPRKYLRVLSAVVVLLIIVSPARATTWFVNNKAGQDTNDGRSESKAFATFARTVQECKTSDKIVLANTGVAYREQLNLTNLGGTPANPFIIEGNGAVINGFREIKTEEWKKVGEHLYFIPLDIGRLGAVYYFLCDGKRIRNARKDKAEELAAGEMLHVKEGFYFRCADDKTIADYPFSGLTFINPCIAIASSSYIICRNIVTEYSADDGIGVHGECRGLFFENIECRNNGDQPISMHDTSEATVRNAYFHHNGTGIGDANHSRTYYNGVLCEENEAGCIFINGYHTMVDCVIRNNGRYQLNIGGGPVDHLPGHEESPLENATVILKNVLISCDTNNAVNGIVLGQEGENNRLIMENCIISGCNIAIMTKTRKPTDDSFCHVTASAFINCAVLIQNDNPASKFRFYGDYNVYGPAGVKWLDKSYATAELEAFLKANGSDKESRIGTLTVKDGKLVDEGGKLMTGKLQSIGPAYLLDTSKVFNKTNGEKQDK